MVNFIKQHPIKPLQLIAIVVAIVVIGVLAGLLIAAGPTGTGGTGATNNATIAVTGNGVATGKPDTLTLSMAVSTNARSATTALDRNDAEMAKLEAVFKAAGVPLNDLQTNGLTLSPNYSAAGSITGYGVEDDLTVILHHLADAGAVIDAGAHAVGNDTQIQGLSFSISDTSALRRTARTLAMQDAQSQAADLAKAGGDRLGSIEKITDTEQTTTPTPPPYFSGLSAGVAKSAVPLQAGSEQLSVQVNVIYSLKG